MIPVSLQLTNFTSYGVDTPTLDFRPFHLAVLSGRNGAGKSSLLDAITWCLWGTSRAGDNSDKLVKQGEKEMRVEFEFELDKQNFKVLRTRTLKGGGLSRLDFYAGDKNLTEGTIKATQEKIINTLHLTYETFTNSSFLRQGNADEFTVKGATDRKRILAEILNLSRYDGLEEKAKEAAKDLDIKIEGLNYSLTEIDSELGQKEERKESLSQIELALKLVEAKEKEEEAKLKEVRAEGELLAQKEASLKKSSERVTNLKIELLTLKTQYEEKEITVALFKKILIQEESINKKAEILKLLKEKAQQRSLKQEERNTLQSELTKLKTEENAVGRESASFTALINEIKTRGHNLKTELIAIEKEICPTCSQPLQGKESTELKATTMKKIRAEIKNLNLNESGLAAANKKLTEINKQILNIEEKIKTATQELEKSEEIQKQIDQLEETTTLKIKLSEAKEKIEPETRALTELKKLVTTKEASLAEESSAVTELASTQTQLVTKREQYQSQEVIYNQVRTESQVKRTQLGAAQKLVERSTQLENLKEEKLKEKEKLGQEKNDYEELSLAFGKKGIQAMIIENAIPEIELEANNLLDKLTDGRMRVEFITQREAKTGGTIETLDIIISDENGSRSYELYSGGEAFRVNFAIRLALSKLLTHRAGAKLQFLVIDEGFGTQDVEGRDKLIEAINLIKNDYAKILVITHIEELKEAFPNQIQVSKNTTGSTFQIIG